MIFETKGRLWYKTAKRTIAGAGDLHVHILPCIYEPLKAGSRILGRFNKKTPLLLFCLELPDGKNLLFDFTTQEAVRAALETQSVMPKGYLNAARKLIAMGEQAENPPAPPLHKNRPSGPGRLGAVYKAKAIVSHFEGKKDFTDLRDLEVEMTPWAGAEGTGKETTGGPPRVDFCCSLPRDRTASFSFEPKMIVWAAIDAEAELRGKRFFPEFGLLDAGNSFTFTVRQKKPGQWWTAAPRLVRRRRIRISRRPL